MARYIDADKLIEALQVDYDREGAKADEMAMIGNDDISVKYSHGQFCYLNAIEQVKDTPTADVVPKSEVAREIFEEIEKHMVILGDDTLTSYFRGIGWKVFAELKKKYTEVRKE